ncbi:MAG: c-type cytochrome, partial [Bacteroidetes bacterium]|nr:c-type cytochrome [Bacteroidota bacterium]
PAITDEVNYGKYLVQGVAQCFACHSASFEKMNEMEPAKSDGYMGGGNGVLDHDRKPVYSANITMDKETGIGKWTKEDFVKAVRMMQRPDGKNLRYPMEPYQQFSEAEVGCIYEYLKTVPTLNHKVDRQWN